MSSEYEPDLMLKAELDRLVTSPATSGTWRDVEERVRRKRTRRRAAGALVAVVAVAAVGYGAYSAYIELRPERAVVVITDPYMFEPGFGATNTPDPARTPSEQAAWLADQMANHFAAADLVVAAANQVADEKNPRMEFGLVARDSDKRFVNVIVYTSSGDSLPRDAISGGRPSEASEDVSIAGTTQAILVELPMQEAWQIVALLPDHTVINIISGDSGQSPQLGVSPRPPLDRAGVIEAVEVLMGLMEAKAGSAAAYLATAASTNTSTAVTEADPGAGGADSPYLSEAEDRDALQALRDYLRYAREGKTEDFRNLLAPDAQLRATAFYNELREPLEAEGPEALIPKLLRPMLLSPQGYVIKPTTSLPADMDAWARDDPEARVAVEVTMMNGAVKWFRLQADYSSGLPWRVVP